jgi:hypothetical protein
MSISGSSIIFKAVEKWTKNSAPDIIDLNFPIKDSILFDPFILRMA